MKRKATRRLPAFGGPAPYVDIPWIIGHLETLIHNEEYECDDLHPDNPRAVRLQKAQAAHQLLCDISNLL